MTGRPPMPFDQNTVDEVCERLAGGESMSAICKDEHIPSITTLFKWMRENESFATEYARAREAQAEGYVDKILEITETEPDVQRARLKVDVIKWHASKMKPKKYGDKITQEHTGADGGAVVFKTIYEKE